MPNVRENEVFGCISAVRDRQQPSFKRGFHSIVYPLRRWKYCWNFAKKLFYELKTRTATQIFWQIKLTVTLIYQEKFYKCSKKIRCRSLHLQSSPYCTPSSFRTQLNPSLWRRSLFYKQKGTLFVFISFDQTLYKTIFFIISFTTTLLYLLVVIKIITWNITIQGYFINGFHLGKTKSTHVSFLNLSELLQNPFPMSLVTSLSSLLTERKTLKIFCS